MRMAISGKSFSLALGLAVLVAPGCMVPQSRYDRLATEYHAENQARRQLEDEVQRRDGEMNDMRSQLRDKETTVSALEQETAQSKERIAQLQKALEEAKAVLPDNENGDIDLYRTSTGFAYRIKDQLLFDTGSAAIREAGKKALLTIAKEIKDKGYTAVRIDGHTDNDPVVKTKDIWKNGNYELSIARALSVFAVLSHEGKVPETVFTLVGFGPSSPVVKGDTDSAKAKNRRVEIHIAVPNKN